MFWGEPVVDRDDDDLRLFGNLPADHIVSVQIADHPAAPVKEDEGGEHTVARSIETDRHRAGVKIADVWQRWRRRPKCGTRFAVLSPRLRGGDLIDWRRAET